MDRRMSYEKDLGILVDQVMRRSCDKSAKDYIKILSCMNRNSTQRKGDLDASFWKGHLHAGGGRQSG